MILDNIKRRDINQRLTLWYKKNKRDLPWRKTKDPYKIWISEVVLQQTRVAQGLSYYLKFIDKFAKVNALAKSSEESVLKAWQGLGYYSRARNLHKGARQVVSEFDSKVPSTYKEILSIRGIGDYTAAAILSIAFDEPYAVVDGNVYRVLSRLFAIDTPINTSHGKKQFSTLAQSLLDIESPGLHNQALMEFGALHCTPSKPDCISCPINDLCMARKYEVELSYPVKNKTIKAKNRYFHYFVIKDGQYIYLKKRTENDIWKNMYDFPCLETTDNVSISKLIEKDSFNNLFSDSNIIVSPNSKQIKHILTHQHIYASFYSVKVSSNNAYLDRKFIRIKYEDIFQFPIPRLIHRYLEWENDRNF